MTTKKKPAEPTGYTLGSWRGVTQYQCAACAYNTLELAKIAEHIASMHPVPEPIEGFVPAATAPLETLVED